MRSGLANPCDPANLTWPWVEVGDVSLPLQTVAWLAVFALAALSIFWLGLRACERQPGRVR